MWVLPPKLIHAVHNFVSLHRVGPGYFARGCNGDRRYSDIEPRRAVKNVTNAKANAMKNDSTWGIRRAVEGIQRITIETTGNARDLGSLFLYHTWVIFVTVNSVSRNSGDSLTIAMKILTARKVVAIQEERWCHSKAFFWVQYVGNMVPIKWKAKVCWLISLSPLLWLVNWRIDNNSTCTRFNEYTSIFDTLSDTNRFLITFTMQAIAKHIMNSERKHLSW